MSEKSLVVGVVGAGPRGLSVVERLAAHARRLAAGRAVTVHLIDPRPPGAGREWRTGQDRSLLLDTVAGRVTAFAGEGVTPAGAPQRRGPGLYEWARALARSGAGGADAAEARRLGPDSYPTRALAGSYFRWVFRQVAVASAESLALRVHAEDAVALDDGPGGTQEILLAGGRRLTGLDAVVLAQGRVPVLPTAQERGHAAFAAEFGLVYVAPAHPADADLSAVAPGEPVVLRGLGLNFFDYLTLLTTGRGGRFDRDRDGRVTYRPSGREPRILCGARRAVPYGTGGGHRNGGGRQVPRVFTEELTARLRAQRDGPLDFRESLWPLIAREMESAYYTALLPGRDRPERAPVLSGVRRGAGTRADAAGGPVEAALDVLHDLRDEVRLAVDHAGLGGESRRRDLDGWFAPLGTYLSGGPAARRTEELIALVRAGVARIVGPGMQVAADREAGKFACESPSVSGSRETARVLVEGRLPGVDLRRTADPLLRHLLDSGQCRPYGLGPGRTGYVAGGLAVTGRPFHVVDGDGVPHPQRFALGVPTESADGVTAAAIRPSVGSATLTDTDAIARAVLAPAGPPPRGRDDLRDRRAEEARRG
ncbi:FAD/NAD(P)-binding protein [Streptomyces sp. CMB-StM0423]|uniref:FAD/NAD(P)-binding protein n=1 Tax=Streptomyces sp. CMB-StM0423 TaxID=2059884 RepID=UPI000C700222|nr:FAD/NAD(P)-binding protein [Streptomyces sp. CMB-StM0423]AUH43115.1 FAD-binding protein [Streptomyces sp. CMB-StM0423]